MRSGGVPSASRNSLSTSMGAASSLSPNPRRSAKSSPSGKCASWVWPQRTVQAVLPTPAGPVTSTTVLSASGGSGAPVAAPGSASLVISANSSSRPRNPAGGRGSRRGATGPPRPSAEAAAP